MKMNIYKCLSIILVLLLNVSCHDFWFQEIGNEDNSKDNTTNESNLSELDLLFENGFTLKLEQIYAYSKVGSEYLPLDSVFKDHQTITTLPNYAVLNTNILIMNDMIKGESWIFDEPVKEYHYILMNEFSPNTWIDTIETRYTPLHRINSVNNKNYKITYLKDDNIYINYKPKIQFFTEDDEYTNLVIEKIEYSSKELLFITNKQYVLNQSIFPPLTSNQVKIEISKGNYELYLKDGNTYYKIGENLYVPSLNGDYIYVGSTNNNGQISGYSQVQYYLKFKLL